jgi:1,2-diacylglycerol 3-beta-glucosyltransferase
MLYFVVQCLLFVSGATAAVVVAYLLLLAGAALIAPPATSGAEVMPWPRFLLLVPAHNEERLLPRLLSSLAELRYPSDCYRVHVVADNCSDQTATLARAASAAVHERQDAICPGKGNALQWLLEQLQRRSEPHEAVIILDADSVVSPNFLSIMAAHLARGERVVQAYYAVGNPQRSVAAGLRFSALAALHYLRPQGRMVLGASAGLKGNGMMFAGPVLQRHPWTASVTEDIELHMALLLDGERVHFAPDAVVWAEMPDSLAKSESQHHRWESGRLLLARRYVPQLLRAAWAALQAGCARQAFILFDAVMEHLIPPFAILVGTSGLLLVISCVLWIVEAVGLVKAPGLASALAQINLGLGLSLLAGQAVYLFTALRLVKAPPSAYWQLAYAPVYIFWKVGQYLRAAFSQAGTAWVRTPRNDVS